MKEGILKGLGLLLVLCFSLATSGQEVERAEMKHAVSGVVTDMRGRKLPYVNVHVTGERVSTVTNEDGFFTIKTVNEAKVIVLTHVGYQTQHFEVPQGQNEGLIIRMKPNTVILKDVVVKSGDAKRIFYEAMDKIPENYADHPEMMKCFYRECVQKRNRYINIAEAVANLYKPS